MQQLVHTLFIALFSFFWPTSVWPPFFGQIFLDVLFIKMVVLCFDISYNIGDGPNIFWFCRDSPSSKFSFGGVIQCSAGSNFGFVKHPMFGQTFLKIVQSSGIFGRFGTQVQSSMFQFSKFGKFDSTLRYIQPMMSLFIYSIVRNFCGQEIQNVWLGKDQDFYCILKKN